MDRCGLYCITLFILYGAFWLDFLHYRYFRK